MEESSGDAGKGYFLTVLETIDDTLLIPWQPPFKSWSFCTASLSTVVRYSSTIYSLQAV